MLAMIWLVFALLTALFLSIMNVFGKKALKTINEYIVAWSLRFFALPFVIPLLFFAGIPFIGIQFWPALFITGCLNAVSLILYMKAIKYSDLSLSFPMITFTPLFLLVTSPLIVNEFPDIFGIIGILLIVLGAYVLKIKEKKRGYLAPFKALLKEKGPRYMLIVAFIWSISANLEKIGVQNSSPIFWVVAFNILSAAVLFPIMLHKSQNLKQIPKKLKSLVPIGFFYSLSYTFQMMAINLALVVYVNSIKRTSVIMTVLLGYLFFKEKGIKERLVGAIIMVIGVLLIALF